MNKIVKYICPTCGKGVKAKKSKREQVRCPKCAYIVKEKEPEREILGYE